MQIKAAINVAAFYCQILDTKKQPCQINDRAQGKPIQMLNYL